MFSHWERGKTGRAGGAKRELKSRPCFSIAGMAMAGMGVEIVGLIKSLVTAVRAVGGDRGRTKKPRKGG